MIIQGFGGFGNSPSAGCPANPFNIVAKVVDTDNFLIQEQTPAACNLRITSGDSSGADNLGFRDNATGIITLTYTVVFTDTTPPAGETCDMVLTHAVVQEVVDDQHLAGNAAFGFDVGSNAARIGRASACAEAVGHLYRSGI